MRCCNVYVTCQIDTTPIPELTRIIRSIRNDMRFYEDEHNLSLMLPIMYMLLHLSGKTDGDFAFLEESRNLIKELKPLDRLSGVSKWGYYSLMMVAYIFGDYEQAHVYSEFCKGLLGLAMGAGDPTVAYLYDGLIHCALARTLSPFRLQRHRHIRCVKERIKSLNYFSRGAPLNFSSKVVSRPPSATHANHFFSMLKVVPLVNSTFWRPNWLPSTTTTIWHTPSTQSQSP